MEQISYDQFVGCIMGGAIGDALGAPVEFLSLENIRSNYGTKGIRDYVEFPNSEGEFTDNTQMMLFTAEGLVEYARKHGNIATEAWHAYLRWLVTQGKSVNTKALQPASDVLEAGWLLKRNGLFKQRAPGKSCLSALEGGIQGSINKAVNNSKGCGTIMRIAPVGLALYYDSEYAFKAGCDISALTHGHPSGYLSGGFFAALISFLAKKVDLDTALSETIRILKTWDNHRETLQSVEKALKLIDQTTTISHFDGEIIPRLGGGWVAEEALSIALYCGILYQGESEEGILMAVNHDGNSDCTGTLVGNILGLTSGMSALPDRWIRNLRFRDIILETSDRLYEKCFKVSYIENGDCGLIDPPLGE
ncbi:MAG: ADP-ribosylglycohydrolase family protein [Fibrobacter sp.]|nr:ADP-ribosylglycohydrolase family protein [Fibrobacter sp.]